MSKRRAATTAPPPLIPVYTTTTIGCPAGAPWARWGNNESWTWRVIYQPPVPCAQCTPHAEVGMGCTTCGRGYILNLDCVHSKDDAIRVYGHVQAKPWASAAALESLKTMLQDRMRRRAERR